MKLTSPCLAVTALATLLINPTVGCSYSSRVPMATIGQALVLRCTITCHSLTYNWYRLRGSERDEIAGETDGELLVSENVTSVSEVGGQMYECGCSENDDCEIFEIGVKPIAKVFTSVPVAKSGSTVNITCTAESYPPANSVENFHMKHPKDQEIDRILLPGMNGVVHIITSASVEIDSGEYECTVIVTLDAYPDAPLQSDNSFAKLIVYGPPKILAVTNYTISEQGQVAVLSCSVSNTDDDLKVRVNWTTDTNNILKGKQYYMFREGNVFSLLIYNSSAGEYKCKTFSVYSPKEPEDTKTLAVIMKGTPSSEAVSSENCDANNKSIVIYVVLAIVALVGTFVGFIVGLRLKNIKARCSAYINYIQARCSASHHNIMPYTSHSNEVYVQRNSPEGFEMQGCECQGQSPVQGESQAQFADSPPSDLEENPTPTAESQAKPTVEAAESVMLTKLSPSPVPDSSEEKCKDSGVVKSDSAPAPGPVEPNDDSLQELTNDTSEPLPTFFYDRQSQSTIESLSNLVKFAEPPKDFESKTETLVTQSLPTHPLTHHSSTVPHESHDSVSESLVTQSLGSTRPLTHCYSTESHESANESLVTQSLGSTHLLQHQMSEPDTAPHEDQFDFHDTASQPRHPIKRLFERSQSMFSGSPPTLPSSGSFIQRLLESQRSAQRRMSSPREQEQRERLLSGRDTPEEESPKEESAKFTVGGDD